MPAAITCTDVTFAWPDGGAVFEGLSTGLGAGRTGLVGNNGSGKSTLLRLIAGELLATSGSITVTGELGYLPQDLILAADRPVDEVLGVADIRTALASIERGGGDECDFATVGEQWDIEERTRATLEALGLGGVELDHPAGELSGGELVLLGLAAQLLRRPDVLLLDEPTNNLDPRARKLVYDAIRSWPGPLVVVSHDRELLERMDRIAELRDGGLRLFGGSFSAYEEAVRVEQGAAERAVRAAESDVKRQKRDLAEARIKLDRRQRYGKKMFETKREPKVRMRKRAEDAQIAAGKHRGMHVEKLGEARERLKAAEDAARDDDQIRIELPATAVAQSKQVLQLSDVELRNGSVVDLDLRGPERIALTGPNGGGKTTLLETVIGTLRPRSGVVSVPVSARRLPQRLDVLDDERSTLHNVAGLATTASDNVVRAQLARFLLRGSQVDQPAGTLSGGERFRATLATLLLAEPAPQLLLLDEPTNNLDLASTAQLVSALNAYRGALIVVSHDERFLAELNLTRQLHLATGTLTDSVLTDSHTR